METECELYRCFGLVPRFVVFDPSLTQITTKSKLSVKPDDDQF